MTQNESCTRYLRASLKEALIFEANDVAVTALLSSVAVLLVDGFSHFSGRLNRRLFCMSTFKAYMICVDRISSLFYSASTRKLTHVWWCIQESRHHDGAFADSSTPSYVG